MISDYEIDEVLSIVAYCLDQTACFRGKVRREEFINMVHNYLHNKQSETTQGVCHRCLGTGYEPDKGE